LELRENLTKTVETLTNAFPEAIEIASPTHIAQNGLYLSFMGVKPASDSTGSASFGLIVAGQTMNKDASGALKKVQEHLKTAFDLSATKPEIKVTGVKPAAFENSTLFIYMIEIAVTIKYY
jgi:hypothetical protein